MAPTSTQILTEGQRPLLFDIRRDLICVTSGICTMPTIRNWKPTTLTAPSQRLIRTYPRSATCAISAAQITTPMSDQTPGPGSALHPHPRRPPTYHARLPLPSLPSGQTLVQGLPLPLLEQSDVVHSPPPGAGRRWQAIAAVRCSLPSVMSFRREKRDASAGGRQILCPLGIKARELFGVPHAVIVAGRSVDGRHE